MQPSLEKNKMLLVSSLIFTLFLLFYKERLLTTLPNSFEKYIIVENFIVFSSGLLKKAIDNYYRYT